MDIIELSPTNYNSLVTTPFSIFDTVEFSELNCNKAEIIKYLIFNDGKNRFGLIMGIKENTLIAPFSAPYACFSPITKNNKVKCYNEACKSLLEYAQELNMKSIRITLPPTVYDENHIARIYNSLYIAGFKIKGCDLNFQYDLEKFDENYMMSIDPKARQKLRAAFKNELIFEKTTDIATVYKIIKENREMKNYPLWMKQKDIEKSMKIIIVDFFLVYDKNHNPVASAMIYHLKQHTVQVIYWGNITGSEHLKTMNFLSFKIFEYYKSKNVTTIDIGPSTEYSKPNFGLCDFKQSIGCDTSSKITFELVF